ncbi:hypothetical protein V8C86DRAFT_228218 [Haematococcus lacustris]
MHQMAIWQHERQQPKMWLRHAADRRDVLPAAGPQVVMSKESRKTPRDMIKREGEGDQSKPGATGCGHPSPFPPLHLGLLALADSLFLSQGIPRRSEQLLASLPGCPSAAVGLSTHDRMACHCPLLTVSLSCMQRHHHEAPPPEATTAGEVAVTAATTAIAIAVVLSGTVTVVAMTAIETAVVVADVTAVAAETDDHATAVAAGVPVVSASAAAARLGSAAQPGEMISPGAGGRAAHSTPSQVMTHKLPLPMMTWRWMCGSKTTQ